MFELKNVRLSSGELVCLSIGGSKIIGRRVQADMEKVEKPCLHIAEFESFDQANDAGVVDAGGEWLVPGMVDIHVHSRDPGHEYKETWQSLAQAAYKGGVVAVCDMPNTSPPTLTREAVSAKSERAKASGLDYRLYLGLTNANVHEVAGLLADPELPLCGMKVYYGQSTGGYTFSDLDLLAKVLAPVPNALIVFHSEDQCTVDGNEATCSEHDFTMSHPEDFKLHSRLRSSSSAYKATEAILNWAHQFQRRIHIAHVSTPREMELIAEAQGKGVKVTSEVAPHHLFFSTDDYETLGAFIKMNPPVRTFAEVQRLRQFFAKGKMDCFATDHAPHTKEEKMQQDYRKCPSGVPGIEFFTQLLFKAAKELKMPFPLAERLGSESPASIFSMRTKGKLDVGFDADWVWLKKGNFRVESDAPIASKCSWTPYTGFEFPVAVQGTWHRGQRVYTPS